MSISGSLVGYENNNEIGGNNKKKNSITSRSLLQHNSSNASSMGKHCPPSLNSSISNSVITTTSSTVSHHHHQHHHQQQHQPQLHQQQHLMNAKRKHAKYNNMHPDLDQNNNLHLNSLWSIWYGVLLTLFQGYLAVHGAYRFLGCSLIQWKIEPVAELNLQIVLSGVVFILLPLFFTSAVFKVGNLANDGIKLATGSKQQRCSMAPHDGLEEEAGGGTLRALWTHGGPTAAFVHIVIAMCLLLPRLLLEARIIENGLLPRENIWQTELDFISVSRRNLVVMSVVNSPYQNTSNIEEEDYYNDTMFTAIASSSYSNNLLEINTGKPEKPARKTYFDVSGGVVSGESLEDDSNGNIYDGGNEVTGNASRYGENISLAEIEASDFLATQQSWTTTKLTNATTAAAPTTLTTTLLPKNFEKVAMKSAGLAQSNNLVPTPTTTKTTLGKSTTTITVTSTKTTFSTPTTAAPTTTTADAITSTTRTTGTTGVTETTGSSVTTTKVHHHHHHAHQHHKSNKKHSNRQHRHRSQNHRRHHSTETRLSYSAEYERNAEERTPKPIDFNSLDDITLSTGAIGKPTQRLSIEVSASYEDTDYGRRALTPKSTSTISTTTRDSNIHIVKPEMLPEIIPSTPVATNSKIIEIKTNERSRKVKRMADDEMQVEIEPEYLIGDVPSNESEADIELSASTSNELTATSAADTNAPATSNGGLVRLDGFSGMLQIFFGIEKPIDVAVFAQPPSAEFINLLFALLVWSVRYPAVFWTTTKPFATIFSIQMIASALDIIFSYVGVSNLYKLQVYSEAMPVQNSGLILNGVVTLSLFLLSTILLIASSMIMYLYGHGRLAAKMRDRSLITMKTSETWIYFAHCASLCYVLALAVVKAPLLNDLSATYRSNLHCTTFFSALISVVHILLWIVIWLGLTAKRRWTFKLPPVDTFGITKASTQPLLMQNRGGSIPSAGALMEQKSVMSTASSTDGGVEDIYWPKMTPSSPKLKVTFNEVTSTSDDVLLIGDHEQNDGKRNSPRGTAVCFTSVAGEIDDGDYATLRSATATTVIGIGIGAAAGGVGGGAVNSGGGAGTTPSGSLIIGSSVKILHLSEYDELPPPPPPITTGSNCVGIGVGVGIGITSSDYANCAIVDDNTSEEGKLLACVRDDSVTYASTRDLEPTPPLPPPPPPARPSHAKDNNMSRPVGMAPQAMPESMQLSSSPEHLVSPLAPVTVTVHTNEAHISSSSTPRCLRRADSGVPNEALTPRSDTESTTSPPERAPSESSSGVHSGEERDIEVVIRPRAVCKPPPKPPQPPIQEEPYGRSTNMKMSSFITDAGGHCRGSNSATLPLQRTVPEQKFDYSHCSTMPLPAGCHSNQQYAAGGGGYSTSSAGSMHHSQYSHYKPQVGNYANSAVAMAGANAAKLQQLQQQNQATHTTLPNGVRYSNPHFLRRLPHVTMSAAESPYGHLGLGAGHHTFSKLLHDPLQNSLANSVIPEDRDSANYSMSSDQDCNLYATANHMN